MENMGRSNTGGHVCPTAPSSLGTSTKNHHAMFAEPCPGHRNSGVKVRLEVET